MASSASGAYDERNLKSDQAALATLRKRRQELQAEEDVIAKRVRTFTDKKAVGPWVDKILSSPSVKSIKGEMPATLASYLKANLDAPPRKCYEAREGNYYDRVWNVKTI